MSITGGRKDWSRGDNVFMLSGVGQGGLSGVSIQFVPPTLLCPKPSGPNQGIEATLQERLALYQSAVESARQAGDNAKMRRYDRGLKVSRTRAECWDPT